MVGVLESGGNVLQDTEYANPVADGRRWSERMKARMPERCKGSSISMTLNPFDDSTTVPRYSDGPESTMGEGWSRNTRASLSIPATRKAMTSAVPVARRDPFLIKRGMRTMRTPRLINRGGKAM